MKILFEDWSCPNISDKQKENIQSSIEKELLSFEDDIKPAPENLTVSIFSIPHTQLLNCTGASDNGDELVTFVYPISIGMAKDTKYNWKQGLIIPDV